MTVLTLTVGGENGLILYSDLEVIQILKSTIKVVNLLINFRAVFKVSLYKNENPQSHRGIPILLTSEIRKWTLRMVHEITATVLVQSLIYDLGDSI